MSVIKQDMKIKLRMEGSVNGHKFVIKGDGNGNPYGGVHTIKLTVQEGGPLPFAYDILTTAFEYGNRVFTEYPDDIQDYFKQSFPAGYCWERSMVFEDQGICNVTNDITLCNDCFNYDIRFYGVNFPADGPVMKRKTEKWEPSFETMYVRDGVLVGDVNRTLLIEGGDHYRCDFRTTYRAKGAVKKLPDCHYIEHCIEITEHDKDYNVVVVKEIAKALHSSLTSKDK
uniref:Cyan fluorescent protein n=1 Tax=Micromussa lordhowensis TaxID=1216036 RepID=A0A2H4WV18_9CNID|nr:cyan fluorescent protein [Micromussa lordhowensis]